MPAPRPVVEPPGPADTGGAASKPRAVVLPEPEFAQTSLNATGQEISLHPDLAAKLASQAKAAQDSGGRTSRLTPLIVAGIAAVLVFCGAFFFLARSPKAPASAADVADSGDQGRK